MTARQFVDLSAFRCPARNLIRRPSEALPGRPWHGIGRAPAWDALSAEMWDEAHDLSMLSRCCQIVLNGRRWAQEIELVIGEHLSLLVVGALVAGQSDSGSIADESRIRGTPHAEMFRPCRMAGSRCRPQPASPARTRKTDCGDRQPDHNPGCPARTAGLG